MLNIIPSGIILGMVYACWREENPKTQHLYLGIIAIMSLITVIMI